MTNQTYSVESIRKYLLGQLPESETEQLDALSISDDECAELIRAGEFDLSDAFVRGDLRGSELDYFRTRYLSTARGQEALRFAEALQSLAERPGQSALLEQSSGERSGKAPWTRLVLAAAVLVLATATAWQAFDNRALRARLAGAESARDALERERRATEARQTPVAAPSGTVQAPLATLVLAPQLRGASRLPTVALTGTSGDLAVQLDLDPVDYPTYSAVLLTSTGSREMWRADRLSARTAGSRKTLDLHLPAAALSPQDYVIRVSGVSSRSASEIVGEYRFAVVR